jgi:hypothetical protein
VVGTHESSPHVDWNRAERVRLPKLKPLTTAISLRLPLGVLASIEISCLSSML